MQLKAQLLIGLVVAGMTPCAAAQDQVNYALVKGKVVSVGEKEKDEGVPATLEVVHVYTGPRELVGTKFVDRQYSVRHLDGSRRGSSWPVTPFKLEEEGLWSLREVKKDGEAKLYPVVLSRKGDNPRHVQAVARAEAAEAVDRAKATERTALLKQYAADLIPEVGEWAVITLSASKDADAGAYLDGLAEKPDPKFGLLAQLALDKVLAERKGTDWTDSKLRLVALRGWVEGKADEFDGLRVFQRINSAHQSETLSDGVAVEVLLTALKNTGWTRTNRRYVLIQLPRTAERCASEEARTVAFDGVFEQARTSDDMDFRRTAAEVIAAFPLYPERLKAIEKHLATEKDEKVTESLRAAVKKAKEADKK